MKLIFVRHGETYHNKRDILNGQSNSRLTKKGIFQAKLLAKRLKKEKIDFIFSSDLRRAKKTAKEIKKYHKKVPVRLNKLLRERSFGELENIPVHEFRKIRESLGIKRNQRHLFKPKGGEAYKDVLKRAKKFFKLIYPKYKNKTVLIVSHGGFNKVLIALLTKKALGKAINIKQDNTCVNIARVKGKNKIKVHRINCTRHLK